MNKHYSNAVLSYDKLYDSLTSKKLKVSDETPNSLQLDQLLIDVLEDKARIELANDNIKEAVDLQKDAIRIAESK